MTGQSSCAYCGVDLVGDYHRWLLLGVDHVVPQSEARRLGIPAGFYEDAINLVLACSGCNGYLNRFRCSAEPANEWSLESFADLRDSVFRERDQLIAARRDKERTIFDRLSGTTAPEPIMRPSTAPGIPTSSSSLAADPVTFVDDDQGYIDWLARYPSGWVVNAHRKPNASYLFLHRAECHTIKGRPPPGSQWTREYIKVCSIDLGALHEWARQTTGGNLTPCGRCQPLKNT